MSILTRPPRLSASRRYLFTNFKSGRQKCFAPLMRHLEKMGRLVHKTRGQWLCDTFTTSISVLVFFIGLIAMLAYADGVDNRSASLGWMQTVFPMLLHIVSVSVSIIIKVCTECRAGPTHHNQIHDLNSNAKINPLGPLRFVPRRRPFGSNEPNRTLADVAISGSAGSGWP